MIKVEYWRDQRLAVFARDRDTGSKLTIVVNDYFPYFYIHHADTPPKGDSVKEVRPAPFPALGGELLQQVFFTDPLQVRKTRDKYHRHWEADVPYPQRFIVDRHLTPTFQVDLKKKFRGLNYASAEDFNPTDLFPSTKMWDCYYDYEMAMERFEGAESAGSPIINGGFINAWEKRAYSFFWHPRMARRTEVRDFFSEAIEDFIPWQIEFYDNEQDMLVAIIQFVANSNPDNMIGFNSSGTGKEGDYGFDHPYFVNRTAGLGIDPNHLSPVGRTTPTSLHGRHLLDVQTLWEAQQATQLRDKSLKSIADAATGGRVKLLKDPGKIIDWWHQDPWSLITYNMKDVDATWAADISKDVTEWAKEYWRNTHVDDMMDVMSASVVADVLHLEQAQGHYILPTRPKIETSGKNPYEGATVLTPEVRGVLEWVAVLDCSRMYPNNFISGNISYETYTMSGGLRLPGGHRFVQNPPGLTPLAVLRLFSLRDHFDKLIKEAEDPKLIEFYEKKRQPIKDNINAFYGVMGYRKFRLFRVQCAETVTAMGRLLLDTVVQTAQSDGYKVVYGDTDSIFIHIGDPTNLIPKLRALRDHINANFDAAAKKMGLDKHGFKVDIDKVFSRLFLGSAKKRYAGKVAFKGEKAVEPYTFIRGFEFVRSDSAEATADMQQWLFEDILTGQERKIIEAKVDELCKGIIRGSFPLSYIAPSPTWKKETYETTPIWVRAATASNNHLGGDFRVGDRISYVYVKRIDGVSKDLGIDVVAVRPGEEVPSKIVPDLEMMADKVVREKYRKIAVNLGWAEGVEMLGTGQTSLFSDKWAAGVVF